MAMLQMGFSPRQRQNLVIACHRDGQGREYGFSLVEMLVAIGVLVMISVLAVSVISGVQRASMSTTARVEQFRESRRAFERINQRLSQATLNVYWDYVDSNGKPRTPSNALTFSPFQYARFSELRYMQTAVSGSMNLAAPRGGTMVGQAVFFQAPIGSSTSVALATMNSLVNTVGYFIERGSDIDLRPPTITNDPKVRFRLFELIEPADALTVYKFTSGNSTYNGTDWLTVPLANKAYSRRLADNIVALLLKAEYKDTSGNMVNSYSYSSAPGGSLNQTIEENNLPSCVHITMVAVDEISGRRLQQENISLPDAEDDDGVTALEALLQSHRLNYRKFETDVAIGSTQLSAK